MNRRNLLAAALGLPLAPMAALAAPIACTGSPNWLRNAARGVPDYEFQILTVAEARAVASRVLFEAWKRKNA